MNTSMYTASLELKSDYYYAKYERKDLDSWIFTNSSKIDLHHFFSRFDQISIQLKSSNRIEIGLLQAINYIGDMELMVLKLCSNACQVSLQKMENFLYL